MILTTQKQLRKTAHTAGVQFRCAECGEVKDVQTSGGTGYGYNDKRHRGRPICYACCGEHEKQDMIETGKGLLYLHCDSALKKGVRSTLGKLTNWPGTMGFPCYVRFGTHNIARTRYDVWFKGPDGKQWHGVMLGENTQVCRCHRLKNQ